MKQALGIDIGGSAIKIAIVEGNTGLLLDSPRKIELPLRATPGVLIKALQQTIDELDWNGPVGIGFPGVVKNGIVATAPHLAREWHHFDWSGTGSRLGEIGPIVINDADAAGRAEMAFGAGKENNRPDGGTVLVVTLGTGIGSALFHDGHLLPNTEFGHLELDGSEAEDQAAASIKTAESLSWPEYGARVGRFLNEMDKLVSPDKIIVGGGISENFARFEPYLKVAVETIPAQFMNQAGIVGAALAALETPAK